MTRDEAIAEVADKFGKYLNVANRTATDTLDPGISRVVDDALRMLGYTEAEIPFANPTTQSAEDDLRVQLNYRVLLQVNWDLGPTMMNVSSEGDSYSLQAFRAAAEKDLAEAKAAVLERFGTTGSVSVTDDADDDIFVTFRESLLLETLPEHVG